MDGSRAHVAALTLAAVLLAALALALASSGQMLRVAAAGLPAPIAAGDGAANIPLSGRAKWVVVRWVARRTGVLSALDLRLQANGASCLTTGRRGYGLGDGGTWRVTIHPVWPDGQPDTARTLATTEFRPCRAPAGVVDIRQGVMRMKTNLRVVRGVEYATVVRNTAPAPDRNYTSVNFLWARNGLIGANARNERNPGARDSYYGLDPRELVGYSTDSGAHWALPGGPYGRPAGRNFLPTYVQEYSDGVKTGQPYYYARSASTATRTMVFNQVAQPWTIRALGAYAPATGSGTLTLTVDGAVRARAVVSGPGMVRALIPPTTVLPGQRVAVSSHGLPVEAVAADTAWGRLLGMHLPSWPWHLQGTSDFSSAAPVYPLPACGAACTPGYGGAVIIGM